MALFAGLGAGQGRLPGGRQRGRAARAGAVRGERALRQKVNAWRRPQPPETAEFGRPNLSGVANKPLNRAAPGQPQSPDRAAAGQRSGSLHGQEQKPVRGFPAAAFMRFSGYRQALL